MPILRTLAALVAVIALPAAADTRIEYVNEQSGEPQTAFTIKDGKVRVDDPDASSYTLYDTGTGTFTTVDVDNRTYTRLDEKSMQQLSGQMNSAMAEMRRQLEQMSPEQRAMMEKMMGGLADAGKSMLEVKVDRTGKTLSKAGYECEQVFFSVGSISRTELCVVEAEEFDLPDEDRAALDAMQAQTKRFAEQMSKGAGVDFSLDFESMGGMPVYMKQDSERAGEVLKGIEHDDIDASVFEVPSGFREEKIDAE